MKNIRLRIITMFAASATLAIASSTMLRAAETNVTRERIGIYDSRVIAYAHFWSDAQQHKLNEMVEAARDARSAGQTNRHDELNAALKKLQEQNHLQVFSTAPVDEALADIKDRLPAIQKEAGVSKLISKWDEAALRQHPKAKLVDITDALAREFKPGEKQLKTILEIKKNKPVPMGQMQNMKDH